MRKVALLGATLCGILALVILAFGPLIAHSYFRGNWVMVAALILAICSYAPAHLVRGLCSGTGRFDSYAIVMGADGVMRIVLCTLLALVAVKAVGPYGLVVAVAPLFGVAYVALKGATRIDPGPEAEWSEVTPNLGWLLIGSVFAAGLVNAGPIATGLLAHHSEEALVTQFSYGVLMTRVPLFLFQAVQAALLPRLARLAARDEMDEFRRGFRQLVLVVAAVGAVGIVGSALLGPLAVDLVYGATLSRSTMAALAVSSACYMLALATAQAVIALHGHAQVALGWTSGMVAFVVTTAVSSDELFRRVEYGLMAGSAVAMVAFALAFRARLRSGARADAGSVFEAITDMPIES
jgi:O-antigen/teichoic acid export membrane protein